MVVIERQQRTAIVRLNRPQVRNALSVAMRKELASTFRALQDDAYVDAVILTGNGPAFCAGLDIDELGEQGFSTFKVAGDTDPISAMADFDRPIIGAINGIAATGGFEIALMCDVLIGSTSAVFVDTHARVGLLPGWGLSQKLSRLIGANRARAVHFTGRPIRAEQALQWGLVSELVTPEQLLSTCIDMAAAMSACPPDVLRQLKRVVNEGLGMTLADALSFEQAVMLPFNNQLVPAEFRERCRKLLRRDS